MSTSNSKQKPITFLASFPAIQSAIKITGDGQGMRIQLDIPETEMAEAIKLMLCREQIIKVSVEAVTLPTDKKPQSKY